MDEERLGGINRVLSLSEKARQRSLKGSRKVEEVDERERCHVYTDETASSFTYLRAGSEVVD